MSWPEYYNIFGLWKLNDTLFRPHLVFLLLPCDDDELLAAKHQPIAVERGGSRRRAVSLLYQGEVLREVPSNSQSPRASETLPSS